MNYQKFFPSKYLNAADLDGLDEVPVTIHELREEEIQSPDGATEQKPVLRFEGTAKGLILNRTNADTIANLYGPSVEDWAGKRILLCVEKGVHAFGKKWDVIRIRDRIPPISNGDPSENTASPSTAEASPADAPSLTEENLPF